MSGHGGKRPGAGRPPKPGPKRVRGQHGGARAGSGRPPKPEAERVVKRVAPGLTAKQLAKLEAERKDGESLSAALLRLAGL